MNKIKHYITDNALELRTFSKSISTVVVNNLIQKTELKFKAKFIAIKKVRHLSSWLMFWFNNIVKRLRDSGLIKNQIHDAISSIVNAGPLLVHDRRLLLEVTYCHWSRPFLIYILLLYYISYLYIYKYFRHSGNYLVVDKRAWKVT